MKVLVSKRRCSQCVGVRFVALAARASEIRSDVRTREVHARMKANRDNDNTIATTEHTTCDANHPSLRF
jgi:hypothetical protein